MEHVSRGEPSSLRSTAPLRAGPIENPQAPGSYPLARQRRVLLPPPPLPSRERPPTLQSHKRFWDCPWRLFSVFSWFGVLAARYDVAAAGFP